MLFPSIISWTVAMLFSLPVLLSAQNGGVQRNDRPPDTIRFIRGVSLAEDDEQIITAVKSPSITPDARLLQFLEPRRNVIYEYRISDGSLYKLHAPDSSLAFYFMKPGDDRDQWREFSEEYARFVSFESLITPSSGDTIWAAVELFKGYTVETRDDGDTVYTWHKKLCIVGLRDGYPVSVRPIAEERYYPVGQMVRTREYIISPCIWAGALRLGPEVIHDSLYYLILLEQNLVGKPLGSVVRMGIPAEYDGRFIGKLCASPQGDVYYVNDGNGIALHCGLASDGMSCTRMALRGETAAKSVSQGLTKRDAGISITDIIADETGPYILWYDRQNEGTAGRLSIQRYDKGGAFVKESVISTEGDPILDAQFVGIAGEEIVLLVKWEQKRWRLERLKRSIL